MPGEEIATVEWEEPQEGECGGRDGKGQEAGRLLPTPAGLPTVACPAVEIGAWRITRGRAPTGNFRHVERQQSARDGKAERGREREGKAEWEGVERKKEAAVAVAAA